MNTYLKGVGIFMSSLAYGELPGSFGSTAADTSLLGGLVRDGELVGGIPHALLLSIPTNWGKTPGPAGKGWVWPANYTDMGGPVAIRMPFGQLLAIPKSVNINNLGLSPVGLNLARALQNYGGYVVDSGDAFLFRLDDRFNQSSAWTGFNTDSVIIANNLRVVTNSYNPTNGGPPRGGVKIDSGDGTLSAPLAPPFDR